MKIEKSSYHILVVDDDKRISSLLQRYLVESGYFCSVAMNTKDARLALNNIKTDLIILDVMMPEEDGVKFLESLRSKKINIPVIMLTAMGEVENKITGLETGADDYLVKPFEPKELLLRIANVLKRSFKNKPSINFGSYKFDRNSKNLTKNSEAIFLTSSETMLLDLLVDHAGQLLSREAIAEALKINERSVDVQVVRLRSKIEENPSRPIFLQSVRGKGYILKIDA